MIRHANVFETAGHQVLVRVAGMRCTCSKPDCNGVTLGIVVSIMGVFPKGLGLLEAHAEFRIPTERLCQLVQELLPSHFRRLLAAVQAPVYGAGTEANAQRVIEEVFQELELIN